jgi:sporulation protein YlmC with PRC-barrel domain
MKTGEEIFIAHRLLDEQILDSDGRRCGRVDDLEIEGNPPRISALLVGPERWGANALRIPWEEVDEIDAAVRLRGKAEDLGLGAGDNPKNWLVRRLPWN